MKSLETLLQRGETIRVLGVDDAPFVHQRHTHANFSAIMCANTRFEGMLWGEIEVDGLDATKVLIETILESKFHEQMHLFLMDGLAMGGFNLVDLPALCEALERPCVAVMRRLPNMQKIDAALQHFDDYAERVALIEAAGKIHDTYPPFVFQCVGARPEIVASVLERLTCEGHVPEALRLAHLIGSAIKTGTSSSRA